ncbi:MAG: TonB-dependent receptor [Bacteroidales bacterium]|jgi:outer membrane receptor protein involved in Fe transport|nr:TonB-dependent receptor [Bacteroidales bacterium]
MDKKIWLAVGIWLWGLVSLQAQDTLKGSVTEHDASKKQPLPLAGAILQWHQTDVGTYSGADGHFVLPKVKSTRVLIVKYPRYATDTIIIEDGQQILNVLLSSANMLQSVEVGSSRGDFISVKPILTMVIGTEGLRKAACCNLSESFDNSAAVDVEYSDAVTGAKQISMLGLAGVYSQILLENIPYVRLLSQQFGLAFVPGSWMESISISKGTSSVINGYEGITGQINVDYKKPETNREKMFLNLYGNSQGKGELNLNSRVGVNEHASTLFFLHAESQMAKWDMNHDHFLDVPLNYSVNAMNRWDYHRGAWEGRTLLSYLWEDRVGGEKGYRPNETPTTFDGIVPTDSNKVKWGFFNRTHRLNAVTKNGFLLKGDDESVGTILSFTFHDTRAIYGPRNYDARQYSGYVNILYSNKYGRKKRSKLTMGGSLQFDYLNEQLTFLSGGEWLTTPGIMPQRIETVPGVFVEYAYVLDEKLVVMPAFRVDYNTLYKEIFWTPRFHLKWMPLPNTSLRLSAGKGYRTPAILSENSALLVSNRQFAFPATLQPEEAYNGGISLVQSFVMKGGKSSFSIDYYYTRFVRQWVIDLDQDPRWVYIYNLQGQSYSHSIQGEFTLFPLPRFEITLAYRYNHVQQTTNNQLQAKALTVPHKVLLNLHYATKFDKWKFNITAQYNSSTRLPDTKQNPQEYQLPSYSKDYVVLNAQITKKFRKIEVYVGGENLLNYRQQNPLISAHQPFGDYFDASIIYAPIMGIMGYAGMRWTIN